MNSEFINDELNKIEPLGENLEHETSEDTSDVNAEQEKNKAELKEENVEPENYILTPELIYSGQIDPMIGMEDIKLEEKR